MQVNMLKFSSSSDTQLICGFSKIPENISCWSMPKWHRNTEPIIEIYALGLSSEHCAGFTKRAMSIQNISLKRQPILDFSTLGCFARSKSIGTFTPFHPNGMLTRLIPSHSRGLCSRHAHRVAPITP